jgi:hypothetical protein
MRILHRGQKEVVLRFGKEYRFVVDFRQSVSTEGKSETMQAKKEVLPGEE